MADNVRFKPEKTRSLPMEQQALIFEELLKNKQFYDIASALRGSDLQQNDLKWLFTARIRGLLHMDNATQIVRYRKGFTNAGNVYTKENLLDFLDRLDTSSKDVFTLMHFLDHTKYALLALEELHLIDEDEMSTLSSLVDNILTYILYPHSIVRARVRKEMESILTDLEMEKK